MNKIITLDNIISILTIVFLTTGIILFWNTTNIYGFEGTSHQIDEFNFTFIGVNGWTNGQGKINMYLNVLSQPEDIYRTCVHEVLHNWMKETTEVEHRVLEEIDTKVRIDVCDELMERG